MSFSQPSFKLDETINNMDINGHKIILSYDNYCDKGNNKKFLSVKNHKELIKELKINQTPNYYEVINDKCQMYADIEWNS